MKGFKVYYRNPGHWDIWDDAGRIFAIRGGPGRYFVRHEGDRHKRISTPNAYFKTVQACMNYICDKLMFELIVAKGQTPTVIESWNVKE